MKMMTDERATNHHVHVKPNGRIGVDTRDRFLLLSSFVFLLPTVRGAIRTDSVVYYLLGWAFFVWRSLTPYDEFRKKPAEI